MQIEIVKDVSSQPLPPHFEILGGYNIDELRQTRERPVRPDLFGKEVSKTLTQSAVNRALYYGFGQGEVPHLQFPSTEHFQHYIPITYTNGEWAQYGNLESEHARIAFMLDNHPERGFPKEFEDICAKAVASRYVLEEWASQIQVINETSSSIYETSVNRMQELSGAENLVYQNAGQEIHQPAPVYYESSASSINAEKVLWREALNQAVSEFSGGDYGNLRNFLHLYNRIKDPITPLDATLSEQEAVFIQLFERCRSSIKERSDQDEEVEKLIVQLALESSFLALPAIKDVECVVYGGPYELPYVYFNLAKLPRAEFARPERVRELVKEIVDDSERFGQAVVTPLTVSYLQAPGNPDPEPFIIDGNNRATALMLMKYADFACFDEYTMVNRTRLNEFLDLHGLDTKWRRDLVATLESMSAKEFNHLQCKKEIVSRFANSKIPALLVHEPNFHTVNLYESDSEDVVLLQPMHQTIYNKNDNFIIQAGRQSHGRAAGNNIRMGLSISNTK